MTTNKPTLSMREAVIRFAGDSGDGMQLTGTQFTNESAFVGNDVVTFPNFPAEIRAPAGTTAGVSSFQVKIGQKRVWTAGDRLDTLVAMNPAALSVHLADLKPEGTLIVNSDAFSKRNLDKTDYQSNPLEDPALFDRFKVLAFPMTSLVTEALADSPLSNKDKERCKNLFALGVISHMYQRDITVTERWLKSKFSKLPDVLEGNLIALNSGLNYAENSALLGELYVVEPAEMPSGTYRNVNGNTLLAYGLITGAHKANKRLVLGSYPITPASDILHELARHKQMGVRTFQAEDEIAAVCAAIGASFGGELGITSTSGPGFALKGEAIGLAMMTELPLVVVNVQRGGPSTGLPTKTEQSDLLQVMYGRNGESPVVVLAASTPLDAFEMGIEAVRIALTYMTPVVLLSDGFIANGAAPWRIPDAQDIPEIPITHATDPENFAPYNRDPETLARQWAVPGTPGLEHRLGGLEKEEGTGGVCYDGENHEKMIQIRAQKVERVANSLAPMVVEGSPDADVLVVGWGSTYGAIGAAVAGQNDKGSKVAHLHIKYINPFPNDLGEILSRYKKILICEINSGQLALLLRAKYLIDFAQFNKIQGFPLMQSDIETKIEELVG